MIHSIRASLLVVTMLSVACTTTQMGNNASTPAAGGAGATSSVAVAESSRPADADQALSRLNVSPRHGEWVTIPVSATDTVRAWVVYPQRQTKAPVVVVIHEIFGLTNWVRAVADQIAADGFIAIAPDLLTMKHLPDGPDSVQMQAATAAIRTLDPQQVQTDIDAVARYGMSLPSALPKYGIVGFCWGGGVSFAHATHAPALGASVVYYGVSPRTEALSAIHAPVLGLYAGSDARVDATIPPADSALRAMGKIFTYSVFDGAGHGFLRQQTGMNGANKTATEKAWPATIAWFKRYLEG